MSLAPGTSDPAANNTSWSNIWTLNVPNKVKHFIWRACHESLRTKKNLLIRKVTRNSICERCQSETGDTVHALWGCQPLKEIWWEEQCFRNQLTSHFVDFRDLWTGVLNYKEHNLAERFAYIAWSIWYNRNAARTNTTHLPLSMVYQDLPAFGLTTTADPFDTSSESHPQSKFW